MTSYSRNFSELKFRSKFWHDFIIDVILSVVTIIFITGISHHFSEFLGTVNFSVILIIFQFQFLVCVLFSDFSSAGTNAHFPFRILFLSI